MEKREKRISSFHRCEGSLEDYQVEGIGEGSLKVMGSK